MKLNFSFFPSTEFYKSAKLEDARLDDWATVREEEKNVNNRVAYTCDQILTPYISFPDCERAVHLYNTKLRNTNVDEDETFDWRKQKVTMPFIKSQGPDCGCCYAMATADNISIVHHILCGKYVELSSQAIIDHCEWTDGCDGGIILLSFMYAIYKGLPRLQDYPYVAKRNESPKKVLPVEGLNIHAVMRVGYYSEENIKKHIKVHPITVTMYWGYCLSLHKSTDIYEGEWKITWWWHNNIKPMGLHSLLLIGFGHNDCGDYWLLKNSHGEACGDRGVLKIRRGGQKDVLFGTMENGVLKGDGLVIKANFPVGTPD